MAEINTALIGKEHPPYAELEVWAETQKAEKVVSGRATVALPTRA